MITVAANDTAVKQRRPQQQHTAAIEHMTTRELHAFLFGTSLDHCRPFPVPDNQSPAATARGGKRWRTENLKNNETHNSNKALDLDQRLHTVFGRHGDGGVEAVDGCFTERYSERSKAAAKAAGAGGGGGDGGGWCLLQKFIGPAGSKNSTLR